MAEKKQKVNISKLSVVSILPKVQSIISDPEFATTKKAEVGFDIAVNPLFNLEINTIKIELCIVIELMKKKIGFSKVAEFNFDFFYEYHDLKDLMLADGEPAHDIFLTCSSLSYSTLRGIIFAKASNTCIENILLPVVSGAELINGTKRINANQSE